MAEIPSVAWLGLGFFMGLTSLFLGFINPTDKNLFFQFMLFVSIAMMCYGGIKVLMSRKKAQLKVEEIRRNRTLTGYDETVDIDDYKNNPQLRQQVLQRKQQKMQQQSNYQPGVHYAQHAHQQAYQNQQHMSHHNQRHYQTAQHHGHQALRRVHPSQQQRQPQGMQPNTVQGGQQRQAVSEYGQVQMHPGYHSGTQINNNQRQSFCGSCGVPLLRHHKFCPICGVQTKK